jgi:pimeloyl-ACP methyl ester carboxylesterase
MNNPWRWTAGIMGGILVLLLVVPLLIPIPPLEGTVPPRELADPDSRFAEVQGLDVHYKVAGEGEGETALVLLHGFAASLFSWREVMAPLAEETGAGPAAVVAFDRPAFGLTERPMPGEWRGRNPYSTVAQAELTLGMIDTAVDAERVILVGHSAGGAVALLTALNEPERFDALILVSPAVYQSGGPPAVFGPLLRSPQLRRLGPLLVRQIREWGLTFARTAWHDPSRITPEVWEGYQKPLQAHHWDRALWELTAAPRTTNLPARLDEVRLPTLVITGDNDRVVAAELSARLADELPDARLVVIENCGHVPHEECPEEFLAAVRAFLGDLATDE